jgi:hypothetical protein
MGSRFSTRVHCARERRLQSQDLLRFLGSLRLRVAGQHEHLLHVLAVFGPDLLQLGIGLQIVIAVRQPESVLPEIEHVLRGVARVLMNLWGVGRAHTNFIEMRNKCRDVPCAVQVMHTCQLGLQGFESERLQCRLVHEACIQVSNLALIRIGQVGRMRQALDDATQFILCLIVHLRERVVAPFIGRYFGRVQPPAVHVAIEIVLRANVSIEILCLDAAGRGGRLGSLCGGSVRRDGWRIGRMRGLCDFGTGTQTANTRQAPQYCFHPYLTQRHGAAPARGVGAG